jgi:TrpR family trp operon transcriptional repressor
MKFSDSLENVAEILSNMESKSDMQDCLEDILTPQEIVDISDRIELLKMLKKGIPQRQIAKELQISITTVSRGSRLLKFTQKGIEKYV